MNATDDTSKSKVLIWDLPVRIGHWLMVACFVTAWLTAESEELRLVHVFAGGAMVGIVLFRILWGLIGSHYARFIDFVRGPGAVIAYLKSLTGSSPQHWVGHNPAGGLAIIALLCLVLASGASGWLNYQDIGGEWMEELHEGAVNTLLAVVLVHLAGVFVGSLAHGENLPRAMVTGKKLAHGSDAISSARPGAAIFLLIWASVVAWLVSR